MSAFVNVPLRLKLSVALLHSSYIGVIRTPDTAAFFTCAANVGVPEHPTTEHVEGQDFPEYFSQWSFHDPHGHFLSDVPVAFDHPELGNIAMTQDLLDQ